MPDDTTRWWDATKEEMITTGVISSGNANHTLKKHAAHTGGTATCKQLAECDICGQEYGNYEPHDWQFDSKTTPSCLSQAEIKEICSKCGLEQIIPGEYGDHEWNTEWSSDEYSHWHTCIICNEAQVDKADHTYGIGGHCSVCDSVAELYWGVDEGVLTLSSYKTNAVPNNYSVLKWNYAITSVLVDRYAYAPSSMDLWFNYCENLTTVDLSNLDTSNVTDMEFMFAGCKSLTSLDLSSFDTSNVTNMRYMFNYCEQLTELNISNFNTENVTSMEFMFDMCSSLTEINLSSFNTQNVETMRLMFNGCSNLTDTGLILSSNFVTSKVETMQQMFADCNSLTSPDLSWLNTENVTSMGWMFYNCGQLTQLNLSSFDTTNVTDMQSMFANCTSLTELNLSSFDTTNVTNVSSMFGGCDSLNKILTPATIVNALPLPDSETEWWSDRDAFITGSITSADAGHTLYLHASHSYGQWQEEIPATCTTAGTKGHKDCIICGNHFASDGTTEITNLTIDALGHNIIHYDAKEPTCTEIGWEAYEGCSRCDYAIDKVEIEALGHDYEEEYTIDKKPTIFSEGSKSRHCTRCDEIETVKIPTLLSTGAIVGICVGFLFILLLIILLLILLSKKKEKQNKKGLDAN